MWHGGMVTQLALPRNNAGKPSFDLLQVKLLFTSKQQAAKQKLV